MKMSNKNIKLIAQSRSVSHLMSEENQNLTIQRCCKGRTEGQNNWCIYCAQYYKPIIAPLILFENNFLTER